MASKKRRGKARAYHVAPIAAAIVVVLVVLAMNAAPMMQPPAGAGIGGGDASRMPGSVPSSVSEDNELAQRVNLGDDPAVFEPGHVLVSLAEGATADQLADACSASPRLSGCSVAEVIDDVVRLELPSAMSVREAVNVLASTNEVESVQPNYRYYTLEDEAAHSQDTASTAPYSLLRGALADASLSDAALESQSASNDPYIGSQWHITQIQADKAWKSGELSHAKSTTVAVIDAGFLVSHEDLADNVIASYDAVERCEGVLPDNRSSDEVDHGTHCAGVISATTNNYVGVAGIANNSCKVLPVRVQDERGSIYTSYVARAYSYLASKRSTYNIRVANVSLGASSYSRVTRATDKVLYDAIQKGRNKGIVSVAAACNDDDATPPFYAFPSDFDNVVSVIALRKTTANKDGVARASYSNYNVSGQKAKNISAPGTNILSLRGIPSYYANSRYGAMYCSMSGTSMAAPVVSGVLGIMFAANPKLTADEAVSKLYSTANDLTRSGGTKKGWDRRTGFGEANAYNAVSSHRPYLSGPSRMKAGKPKKLTVKVGASKRNASGWKWKSGDTSIATVNARGIVKGKKAGRVIITATKGSKKAVQLVTIQASAKSL